jgi:hypothetical protein
LLRPPNSLKPPTNGAASSRIIMTTYRIHKHLGRPGVHFNITLSISRISLLFFTRPDHCLRLIQPEKSSNLTKNTLSNRIKSISSLGSSRNKSSQHSVLFVYHLQGKFREFLAVVSAECPSVRLFVTIPLIFKYRLDCASERNMTGNTPGESGGTVRSAAAGPAAHFDKARIFTKCQLFLSQGRILRACSRRFLARRLNFARRS